MTNGKKYPFQIGSYLVGFYLPREYLNRSYILFINLSDPVF